MPGKPDLASQLIKKDCRPSKRFASVVDVDVEVQPSRNRTVDSIVYLGDKCA